MKQSPVWDVHQLELAQIDRQNQPLWKSQRHSFYYQKSHFCGIMENFRASRSTVFAVGTRSILLNNRSPLLFARDGQEFTTGVHIIYPCEIMRCRSEVRDLTCRCCTDRALSKTTDSWSLQKSQVDKEINHAGMGLDSDRWLTFGWWRAPLFFWEPKEGKEVRETFTSCGGGGGASKVSGCPAEYKAQQKATGRFMSIYGKPWKHFPGVERWKRANQATQAGDILANSQCRLSLGVHKFTVTASRRPWTRYNRQTVFWQQLIGLFHGVCSKCVGKYVRCEMSNHYWTTLNKCYAFIYYKKSHIPEDTSIIHMRSTSVQAWQLKCG